MNEMLFEYRGDIYPSYLRDGNAMQFIAPFAAQFCKGRGLDVGAGKWPLPGAVAVDSFNPGGACFDGHNAMNLPQGPHGGAWDYIFSSHCLEHLTNPIAAIEHWHSRLRSGGTLMLYLPHPEMRYWQPQFCRKHRHTWTPAQMAEIVRDLGFADVILSKRDLAWSFACVGFKA